MTPGSSLLYEAKMHLESYTCLQKAAKKRARLASGSTLPIEEWKAEQQLGGRAATTAVPVNEVLARQRARAYT